MIFPEDLLVLRFYIKKYSGIVTETNLSCDCKVFQVNIPFSFWT